MRFQFLGTASGAPSKQRNTSALAVKMPGLRRWYLVDCGEATQHRIMRSAYTLHQLAAVFITHMHGDHCLGLPGVLSSVGLQGRTQPLPIIGPRALKPMLCAVMDATQSHLNYALDFIAVEDMQDAWHDHGVSVRAHPLSHRVPSYAYQFSAAPLPAKLDQAKLAAAGVAPGPIWGQLQHGHTVQLADGRCLRGADFLLPAAAAPELVVAGDNDNPECLLDACRHAQVLIHEATFSRQHRDAARAYGHCDTETIARFAAAQGIPNLVLTHFSSRYGNDATQPLSIHHLAQEARSCYAGNLFLARDLAAYHLLPDGRLIAEDNVLV